MRRPKYPPLHQPAIDEMPTRYIVSEVGCCPQDDWQIMATADNAIVAAAAFKAAGEQRPNRTIVLCQGARIIDWNPEAAQGRVNA